jgi:hypothetical protein
MPYLRSGWIKDMLSGAGLIGQRYQTVFFIEGSTYTYRTSRPKRIRYPDIRYAALV